MYIVLNLYMYLYLFIESMQDIALKYIKPLLSHHCTNGIFNMKKIIDISDVMEFIHTYIIIIIQIYLC